MTTIGFAGGVNFFPFAENDLVEMLLIAILIVCDGIFRYAGFYAMLLVLAKIMEKQIECIQILYFCLQKIHTATKPVSGQHIPALFHQPDGPIDIVGTELLRL